MSTEAKISIVILGGGGAGVNLAKGLDAKAGDNVKVTLVTKDHYYRHLPGTLRAIVTAEDKFGDKVALPYDNVFGKDKGGLTGKLSKIQFGEVTSVEESTDGTGGWVTLADGTRIDWSILVIATGSNWNGPLRWPSDKEALGPFLENWQNQFATTKSVVVVGSGAVGTELAGEIKDFYPDLEVSVVHRDTHSLNSTYPAAFRQRVDAGLRGDGVKLILGDEVELSATALDTIDYVPGRQITTKKGVKLNAELIIATNGRRGANTDFLQASHSPSAKSISGALTKDGYLQVLPTFQLTTNPRVFAIGDVTSLPEQKTILKASMYHATTTLANILQLVQVGSTGKATRFKNYAGATDSILITNGRAKGSTYIDFFTFFGRPIILGDWFSAKMKSRTLMTEVAKGLVNA